MAELGEAEAHTFTTEPIPLVSSDTIITPQGTGEYFETDGVVIGDLGIAVLWGSREHDQEGRMGMAFIDNQLVFKPADELLEMGMFEIMIDLDGPEPDQKVNTIMQLPNGQVFETGDIEIDEWGPEDTEDPIKQTSALESGWKKIDSDQKYGLFSEPDAKLLSQFKFSFAVTRL